MKDEKEEEERKTERREKKRKEKKRKENGVAYQLFLVFLEAFPLLLGLLIRGALEVELSQHFVVLGLPLLHGAGGVLNLQTILFHIGGVGLGSLGLSLPFVQFVSGALQVIAVLLELKQTNERTNEN